MSASAADGWSHQDLERISSDPDVAAICLEGAKRALTPVGFDFARVERWGQGEGRSRPGVKLLMLLVWWVAVGRDRFWPAAKAGVPEPWTPDSGELATIKHAAALGEARRNSGKGRR